MRRAASMVIALSMAAFLCGCQQPPEHTNAWLSYKYSRTCGSSADCTALRDDDEANAYYAAVGVPEPRAYYFSQWLEENGFPEGDPPAHAIYANLGDLRLGRDMNCVQTGENIACYVTNYSILERNEFGDAVLKRPPLRDYLDIAIENAITKHADASVGTVAMVYRPSAAPQNTVSFYAFDTLGSLVTRLRLDSEGDKNVPRMCMACHGGTYGTDTHSVTGASFLPFDVFYFQYSAKAGHRFDDQQEGLRRLNALVAATRPAQPIINLIGGLYPDGVTTAGAIAQDGWVPDRWSSNPTLYTSVVRPYCRMCHIAQQPVTLEDYSYFEEAAELLNELVCDKHDMPHAEVPFGGLHLTDLSSNNPLYKIGFWWDAVAQRDLGNFFKSLSVTTCLPHD
jgi:hypothetical protein